MSRNPFESSAIAWLRDVHDVDLPPIPPTRPQPSTRRLGEIGAQGPAGRWGFGGLLLITIGAVFSLVASRPGMGTTVTQAMTRAAWAALVIGLGAIVHAWRSRARSRPVCVHFVVGGKTPEKSQLEAVGAARTDEHVGETWLVADAPWAAEALAAAAAARMRCFEPSDGGFTERNAC